MPPALRPLDDEARVAALRAYGVLDTPPEQEYDDLVRLAAAICGTPVAAISLVDDDRQWFKAKVGLELPQTGRDVSFCSHAILEPDQLLEVRDASEDDRFRDNPLVTADGGIRFYAGTPLVTSDDVALGALCVIDERPRRLTAQQKEALEALGRQVVTQVELRRALQDLAHSQQRLQESEARYRHLSEHDALTGLANRPSFHAALERARGRRSGVVFVDLDRFKQVNDEHGHEAGDVVLKHVAAALLAATGPDDVVARLGGDEFVVLVDGADEPALRRLVRALSREVERPVLLPQGGIVTIGCSAGWTLTDGADDPEDLLRGADRAMYDAKSVGRRRGVSGATSLAAELARALEGDELVLHLQPFFDVAGGGRRVVGAEALVRWQHPERGLLLPDAFVPLAERTGLVARLGRRVLRMAATEVGGWERDGRLPAGFRLHVNVAAQQLHTGGVAEDVVAVLAETGLPADRLCLEVTESGLLDVREFTPEAAAELTARGVRWALDDFGTGYSSLTQLRAYPFDVVKVDRSFVAGLGVRDDDEAIVAAVVGLASRLGITPVAEGVETARQLERLRALGCDVVQGHLLGRPAPPSDLLPLLRPVPAPRPAPVDEPVIA